MHKEVAAQEPNFHRVCHWSRSCLNSTRNSGLLAVALELDSQPFQRFRLTLIQQERPLRSNRESTYEQACAFAMALEARVMDPMGFGLVPDLTSGVLPRGLLTKIYMHPQDGIPVICRHFKAYQTWTADTLLRISKLSPAFQEGRFKAFSPARSHSSYP